MSELEKAKPVVKDVVTLKIGNDLFLLTKTGLKLRTVYKDGEDIVVDLTLSGFEILHFLTPIDSEIDRGLEIDLGGRQVTVKREDIATTTELAKWLSAHGVRYDTAHMPKILRYATAWYGAEKLAYTRNGWQKNRAFVVGDTVINGSGVALQEEAHVAAYGQRGTYQQWRDNVLDAASAKPGWIFGILLGLSSPVLPLIHAPNGSLFNLAGPSRTGKTYALKAAAGCWGAPTKDGCLHSFETTVNAAEGLAESANHIGLCLDELAKAIMKDNGMAMTLIYKLANGPG